MNKWLRFLRWFCPAALYEGIEGDLVEQYATDVLLHGEKIANRKLGWNVLRFFRPEIILRNKFNVPLMNKNMLRNNLIIAFRNLLKNKVHSFITITGLVTGMVATGLIGYFVWFENSYEKQYANADNIYRVTLEMYEKGNFIGKDAETYRPTGPVLKLRMPEVVDYVRFHLKGIRQISNKDITFYENNVYMTDPSALRMFQYHFISGSAKHALEHAFEAVITKKIALKYFNSTDVAGETLWYGARRQPVKIIGVIDDLPRNTHLKFDFLLSLESDRAFGNDNAFQSWDGNNDYTYLQLTPHVDLKQFNEKLRLFSKEVIKEEVLVAEPIRDIHLKSHKPYEPEANGNEQVVFALLIIAIVIMIIAWINYINLSTARAVERAKEVGVRKVVGSTRIALVGQFITEAFLFNLLAVTISLVIFRLAFVPFCRWADIDANWGVLLTAKAGVVLLIGLGVSAVFGGFYPAVVLSSFQPATVLKGRFGHSGHGNLLRQGMVVFQFAISLLLITGSITAFYQVNHMRTLDLGMSVDHKIVLNSSFLNSLQDSVASDVLSQFRSSLSTNRAIHGISSSDVVAGMGFNEMSSTNNFSLVGEPAHKYEFYNYAVDADYLPMMGLTLVAGRNFEENGANQNAIIVNEETARLLGVSNPQDIIGRRVTRYGNGLPKEIIGVVKNHYFNSPKEAFIPMFMEYRQKNQFLTVTIEAGKERESLAMLEEQWKTIFPGRPFSYFFLNDLYEKQYQSDQRFGEVFGTFSLLAIVVGCLGLFGLSSYTLIHRTKEVGIRKVMGASVVQLFTLLSAQYVKLSLLAGVVAVPLGYLLFRSWLSSYPSHIELSWWMLIGPLVFLTALTILTVSIQTIKASTANPVKALKYE